MSTNSFETTNWSWQFSQLQQQLGEWLEYQLGRLNLNVPNWQPGWSTGSWQDKLLNLLFWVLLLLFLAWVGWRLWQEFSPSLYSWLARTNNSQNQVAKTTVTQLSVEELLRRSQELYHQGNYREACRCLYFAILQNLHEKAILPHKTSRTDGEYLQLLQLSVTLMQPYETLITTHEQICFAHTEISRENYEQCWQAYRDIQK
ncbi:DUF4129 domain-containing protein [Iningainema tapete]|uniref:DUF4129 domain-containing protein n=1 Tax=Iningainema tapete BLCC-T55 TaxID=2748662 RepID=A0A8J7CHZ2_9CYAN|nr:DUF4129 domain-containing protein [Iningainema tapete]MBD2778365.1 DUF4129 domain-containing protein [Iningainema tapete BLCC-T55]